MNLILDPRYQKSSKTQVDTDRHIDDIVLPQIKAHCFHGTTLSAGTYFLLQQMLIYNVVLRGLANKRNWTFSLQKDFIINCVKRYLIKLRSLATIYIPFWEKSFKLRLPYRISITIKDISLLVKCIFGDIAVHQWRQIEEFSLRFLEYFIFVNIFRDKQKKKKVFYHRNKFFFY
jgi:hypothetical protein